MGYLEYLLAFLFFCLSFALSRRFTLYLIDRYKKRKYHERKNMTATEVLQRNEEYWKNIDENR